MLKALEPNLFSGINYIKLHIFLFFFLDKIVALYVSKTSSSVLHLTFM